MRAPIPKEPSALSIAIRANRERCGAESHPLTIADTLTLKRARELIELEYEVAEIERQMG